jgi:hypothetical protein
VSATAVQTELPLDPPPGTMRFWVYVYPTDEDPAGARLLEKRTSPTIEDAEEYQELLGRVINGKQVGLIEVGAWVIGKVAPVLVRSWPAGEIPQQ